MGILWEYDGNTMGIRWESYGKTKQSTTYWHDRVQLTGGFGHTYYGKAMGKQTSHTKQRFQTNQILWSFIYIYYRMFLSISMGNSCRRVPASLCGRDNIVILNLTSCIYVSIICVVFFFINIPQLVLLKAAT